MNPDVNACMTVTGVVIFTIIIYSLIVAIPTLLLWNWLMPLLFGLKEITLLQALGLNLLSSLLFKSTNFGGNK